MITATMTETADNASNTSIILIEDDEGHARLISKNLTRLNRDLQISKHFSSGKEALHFIFNVLPTEKTVILLDINMPGLSGHEVLRSLKGKSSTKRIPIIILTTTKEKKDVQLCYELGCNAYINKPVDYDTFCETMRELGKMLNVLELPA